MIYAIRSVRQLPAELVVGYHIATHVFQPIQILVAFAAGLAVERLFLFHTHCSRVRGTRFRIYNGECSVAVLVQLLRLMAMCLVIPS